MICVSVQEKSFGDCRAILESCEMAELRADLCRLSVEEVERLVEIRPNLIATCRIANSSEAFAREQLEAAIRRGARYTFSRTALLSLVEMIIPVYGTAIRISAQILAKISSLILLSKAEVSISSACLIRGTLIV